MTSEIDRLSADNAALVGIMGDLVERASRTSASYEYEIDVLREALRDLVSSLDVLRRSGSTIVVELAQEIKWARAAIERTDWRGE
jgi:hypothetical protein